MCKPVEMDEGPEDEQWMRFYKEARLYFEANSVAPSDRLLAKSESANALRCWVRDQRSQYKSYQEGRLCSLNIDRIHALDQIGFQWEEEGTQGQQQQQQVCDWSFYYEQLAQYFGKYGHSDVPAEWAENSYLARWVGRQRAHYKLFTANKRSILTRERISLLAKLKFRFQLRDDWMEKYKQLVKFYGEHNHSMVPTSTKKYAALAKFVESNRQQYQHYIENSPSSMTREKIDLLNKLDFKWILLEDWLVKFRQLEEYVKEHGDSLVPQHYEKNRSLGIWVRNQRTQYKMLNDGKPSKLTDERVKMLQTLNFEWNAYEAKWMACYVQLGRYSRTRGLGSIPAYNEDRKLRSWCEEQRRQYRKFLECSPSSSNNGSSRLTVERRELLELLNFPWPKLSGSQSDDSGSKKPPAGA